MKEAGSECFRPLERSIVESKDKRRGEYFQSIARHFFKHRGAPFFLSSKELDLIGRWEKMEIPLPVVLEGIKRSFESTMRQSRRKARIQSLIYCNLQVLRAFEQYKERKVGHKKWIVRRDKKRVRAKAEVNKFLKTVPLQINYLKETYSKAQKILSESHFDEEELEKIEGEIEGLLWRNALEEEKDRVKKELKVGYGFKEGEEFESILKIKLIKALRDKYKIPYISLYYY